MACIPGRLSRVEVSFDNGDTYINLGGVVDAGLNGNVDELECTTHDDNGVRKYIANHSDYTADVTLRWDESDPGQTGLMWTLFPSPSSFKMRFYLEGVTGRRQFEADAFLTSWSPSSPLDDAAGLDASFRLSSVIVGTVA